MQILFARLFSRITPTEPTFGLVANEWLDSVSTCVKRSTYSVYSAIAAKYIPLGVLICLYTGLRRGEICAMKWGDISYADKSLRVRRAGVRKVSFHTLRHTFATNCVDMGCDPKTLCEILGHSDVSITLNIYVHPSVPAKRELIEQLSSRTDIARNKVQKLRAPHMRRPLSIPLLLFAAVPVPCSAGLSPCRRL